MVFYTEQFSKIMVVYKCATS